MKTLKVDNYVIDTPLLDILNKLRMSLNNGKLKEIRPDVDNIVVTCPHHSGGLEHKAAMNIYIGNDSKIPYGFAHCFACGFKGSFIRFVQECFESSEDFAKKWLIDNFGVLDSGVLAIDDDIVLSEKPATDIIDKSILNSYQSWHPYLAQRGISKEVCEYFELKFDPVHHTIVFPTYDRKGNLVMLPTRSIHNKTFFIPKDIEKPVYGLDKILKNNLPKVIITEGPFDALAAWTFGFPACATLGNPSDHQIDELNNSCITSLYLMFDNDYYGQIFTERVKKRLSKRIIIHEVKIPNGYKDINDLSREIFWNAIKNSEN